jgi:hypothetical protein
VRSRYFKNANKTPPAKGAPLAKLLDLADLRYDYHIITAEYFTPQANISQKFRSGWEVQTISML